MLLLTIFPTEGCNFECLYCYESHDKIVMKKELIESIKSYLTKNVKKFNQVSLSWFGGEPTLCKQTILDINNHILQLKNKISIKFHSSMTTNGFLLDLSSFLKYYNSGIRSYQVTIDGFEHDIRRPLTNGKGTLSQIITNLEHIKHLSDKYQFVIMIRYNILPNDNDYSWYDFLKNKFGNDNRFCFLLRTVNDMGGERIKSLEILDSESKKTILDEHVDYARHIGLQIANDNMELSDRLNKDVCYASFKHHYAIRANGNINKCTVALDNPDNHIGFLGLNGEMHIDEVKNKKWYLNHLTDKCYECKKILSCMNRECPMNRIVNSKYSCNI